jgi:tetratricopeptide (TPR) repeat protein
MAKLFILLILIFLMPTYCISQSQDDFKEIIKYVTRKLVKDKNNPDLYKTRGDAYYLSEKTDSALLDYNRAIVLKRNYYEVHYNRALIYKENKLYSKAIKDFEFCIKNNYNKSLSYFNLGNIFFTRGSYKAAITYYSFVEDAEIQIYTYNNIGLAYHHLKQYQRAIKYFNKTLMKDSTHLNAFYNKAHSLIRLNEYDLAKQNLDVALSIDSDNDYVKYYIGIYYIETGHQEKGCEILKELVRNAADLTIDPDYKNNCLIETKK